MSQLLEKDRQAQWAERKEQGAGKRQPRRVWAIEALKPELDEREFEAAQRAVRECILFFPGAKANLDRVDMAWSDAGLAKQVDAGHALYGLRQAVSKRCKVTCGPNMVEWIVQLHTLQDMAAALSFWRNMGASREPIPDVRPVRRIVQHVLIGMADYYADCDVGIDHWRGARQVARTHA